LVEVLIEAGVEEEEISREVSGGLLYVEESERAGGATTAGRSEVKLSRVTEYVVVWCAA
jgi:hypothetical protein